MFLTLILVPASPLKSASEPMEERGKWIAHTGRELSQGGALRGTSRATFHVLFHFRTNRRIQLPLQVTGQGKKDIGTSRTGFLGGADGLPGRNAGPMQPALHSAHADFQYFRHFGSLHPLPYPGARGLPDNPAPGPRSPVGGLQGVPASPLLPRCRSPGNCPRFVHLFQKAWNRWFSFAQPPFSNTKSTGDGEQIRGERGFFPRSSRQNGSPQPSLPGAHPLHPPRGGTYSN